MGKKSGPAAPAAPDPYATAAAQTQQNVDTAIANANLNRINQYTPYGNITYNVTGYNSDGTPRYEQTQTLSASGQRQLDIQNALAEKLGTFASSSVSRVQDAMAKPFDMSKVPAQVGSINTSSLPGFQYSASSTPFDFSIDNAGGIQRNIGDTGSITQGFGPSGSIQQSVDFSGAPSLPGVTDFSGDRAKVENALYQRATSRLDPRFNQQQSDMEAALVNQGIAKGSDAYNRELDNFNRSKNDAYSSAINDAITAGGAEQSRIFGMGMDARQQAVNEQLNQGTFRNQAQQQQYGQDLGRAQFGNEAQAQRFAQALAGGQFANQAQSQQFDQNSQDAAFYNTAAESEFNRNLANVGINNTTRGQAYNEIANNATLQNQARQQAISEQAYLRALPINEIATLMGATGGVQQPTFQPVANVQQANTDLMGAVYDSYNGQMNAWNAQQQARSQAKGGMFGALGTGAGLALSDKRFKVDAKHISELWNGIKTYVYSYIGETRRRFGVMAQEVQHVPNAVYNMNGVLVVDYGKVW